MSPKRALMRRNRRLAANCLPERPAWRCACSVHAPLLQAVLAARRLALAAIFLCSAPGAAPSLDLAVGAAVAAVA